MISSSWFTSSTHRVPMIEYQTGIDGTFERSRLIIVQFLMFARNSYIVHIYIYIDDIGGIVDHYCLDFLNCDLSFPKSSDYTLI
jgi:hypothetical protein